MLKVENVTKTFKRKRDTVQALCNVSMEIKQGEFVSIIGPSGSGKSTLLLTLGGMSSPNEGKVQWNDHSIYDWDIRKRSGWRASCVGFVFQSFNLVPYLTVYENISVGLSLSESSSINGDSIDNLLNDLGLITRKDHLPSELSVGQQQRVALARALIKKPSLILADEPTGNLDPVTGREVIETIKHQHGSGTTVVMITHDPNVAQQAERVIQIIEGKIIN